jgi:hypothetical protein
MKMNRFDTLKINKKYIHKNMENLTSFGYEQENGHIHYIKTNLMTIDNVLQYLVKRTAPLHDGKITIVDSINEYFQNNCELQIMYMLNGTVKIRKFGYPGEFLFSNV